jgi:dTMP kinase
MPLFITFEGEEGSGKTFQTRALFKKLTKMAVPAVLTHEPGGTIAGERISRLVKWAHNTGISSLTELLLFNASRAQLVEEVIQPALKSGKVVICDRHTDSTLAYQGYGRGLDFDLIKRVNSTAAGILKPELTILLDIHFETGIARKANRKHDRFEQADISFHNKVRQGYLTLAKQEPERWLVIDATLPKDEISKIIWERVRPLLPVSGS